MPFTCPIDPVAIVTAVKDAGLLACAGFGAWVAWQGLETWRKQLLGQSDYDLAKRVSLALLRWREAVRRVREPFIWQGEALPESAADTEKTLMQRVYEKRWDAHADAAVELDALALEAEALWGDGVPATFAPIRDAQVRLRDAVGAFLMRDKFSKGGGQIPEAQRNDWAKASKESSDVVFARPEADDAYWREVIAAIKGVEKILSPHLGRTRT